MIPYSTGIEIIENCSDKDQERILKYLLEKKQPVKQKQLREAEIIVEKALKRNQINNAKKR